MNDQTMKRNEGSVISVDLGTSSVRACLVNHSLEILSQTRIPVSLVTDAKGKAVQDAEDIIKAGIVCIRDTLQWAGQKGYVPSALCFSNAVASLVCLDSEFKPLRSALTYVDLRSHKQAEGLIEEYGSRYFSNTATPMHASYWLPKFLWLKDQDLDLSPCNYYCTIKDLFVYRLTGQFVIDASNAVATGMCDVGTGDWDQRLLEIADISKTQLPQIKPTTQVYDLITKAILPEGSENDGIRIVLGAIDGVLSSLGAGAFKPGQVTTMIGSSGACRIAAKAPLIDSEALQTWSYPLDEGIWICGGAMNNGGLVTQWLVENFSETRLVDDAAYDEMFQAAASVGAGARGLIFLPYLFGERAPIYDENARGVYFGLHANHHREHFARAGLEGILFALYSIFEIIHASDDEIEVRATGGYLRSELMLQIQADIFGVPIQIPSNLEGSSIGAAALALKALGEISSFDEISRFIPIEKTYLPEPMNTAIYREIFDRFQALYSHLQPMFPVLGGSES